MATKRRAENRRVSAAVRDQIADALGCVSDEPDLFQVAADGLKWRNQRLVDLERQVVKLGGWPWEKTNGKG
jgi:hypothetical protein